MKYEIKWNGGKMILQAANMEEAIKRFKELGIEVIEKEISISKFGEYRK